MRKRRLGNGANYGCRWAQEMLLYDFDLLLSITAQEAASEKGTKIMEVASSVKANRLFSCTCSTLRSDFYPYFVYVAELSSC